MTLKEFLLHELHADVVNAHSAAKSAAWVSQNVVDGNYFDPGAAARVTARESIEQMTNWFINVRLWNFNYDVTRAQRVYVMKVLALVYKDRPGYQEVWKP